MLETTLLLIRHHLEDGHPLTDVVASVAKSTGTMMSTKKVKAALDRMEAFMEEGHRHTHAAHLALRNDNEHTDTREVSENAG